MSLFWFLLISLQTQKGMPLFFFKAYDYSPANWGGLHYYLSNVLWEDIFKLSSCTVAAEFCECVKVRIDVYIPHGFQIFVLLP